MQVASMGWDLLAKHIMSVAMLPPKARWQAAWAHTLTPTSWAGGPAWHQEAPVGWGRPRPPLLSSPSPSPWPAGCWAVGH